MASNGYKPINWDIVDKMLIAGCNGRQAAARLGISPDLLYTKVKEERGAENFSAYLQEKQAKGESFLHELQFKKAQEGSERMLMHLGEHRLGQVSNKELSDSQELSIAKGQMSVLMEHIRFLQKKSQSSDLKIDDSKSNAEQKS